MTFDGMSSNTVVCSSDSSHSSLDEPERSPIVFFMDDDDSDEEGDVVEDTDYSDSAGYKFGAYLYTQKISTQGPGRRFSHKLVKSVDNEHQVCDKLQEGDELHFVNGQKVTTWPHDLLMMTLQGLSEDITFIFYRKTATFEGNEEKIVEEYIEVKFILTALCPDDKGGPCDFLSRIKKVVVKVVEITTTIDVEDATFEGTETHKIRHGPTQDFLVVENGKPKMEKLKTSSDACDFIVITYRISETLKTKNSERTFPNFMFAIQCTKTRKFLACNKWSEKVTLIEDSDINNNMRDVKPNGPCLFIPRESSDNVSFYLESLAYADYYLAYDKVRLLRLAKMDPPPFSDKFVETDSVRRNYTFQLV